MKRQIHTLLMAAIFLMTAGAMAQSEEYNKTFAKGWSLMSFPCEPSTSDPVALFASVSDQVVGMDGGTMKHYKELPSAGAGKGYWAYFGSATGTVVSMNCTTVTTPGFTTELNSGWNIIGSPYQTTRWSESTVDGVAVSSSPQIASSLYGYDTAGEKYYATNLMESWGGYAVKASSAGTVSFNPLATNTPPVAETEKHKNCIDSKYYKTESILYVEDGRIAEFTQFDITCALDASSSNDPDGDILTYNWTQVDGPSVAIASDSFAVASFVPSGNATYTFQIEVSDGASSATDTLVVSSIALTGKLLGTLPNLDSLDIYMIDLEANSLEGVVRMTDHSGMEGEPHWSTDGTRIMFYSNKDGDWDIYTMNNDGTGITNVSNSTYTDKDSDWNASGRIVFISDRSGSNEVFDMDLNGNDVRQFTSLGKTLYRPEYSFDGNNILFVAIYGGDNYEIFVMNSDGTNLNRLTNDTKVQSHAAWTPDGRIIFTQRDSYSVPASLMVMNIDGSNIQTWPVPEAVVDATSWPEMTKDGRYIFYRASDSYIHVMLSDGSVDVNLGISAASPDYFEGP